jgi:hypothetical protein
MKKQIIVCFLAAAAMLGICSMASATPLTLDYTVIDTGLGTSRYLYNFDLVLDNHDNSWFAGQQWDWIIFGDRNYYPINPSFAGTGHWNWLSYDSIITPGSTSGGHNGPSLGINSNYVLLPGWNPASIGSTLSWSGTSDVMLTQGMLLWSSIQTKNTPIVQFEVANMNQNPVPVPEPSSMFLVVSGLLGLIGLRKKA